MFDTQITTEEGAVVNVVDNSLSFPHSPVLSLKTTGEHFDKNLNLWHSLPK